MEKRTYTTFEVGEICGVYPTTVISWIKKKQLPAFVTLGGHRRIRLEDLVVFLKKHNFPAPPELSGTRRRVMIVDDDSFFARMVQRAFARHDDVFETSIITNGIEALVALAKKPPDLIVLDVVMPVVDGSTVCSTLRANPDTRHIKIIAVTGKKLPERQASFIRSHTDALLTKPLDVKALIKKAADLVRAELTAA